MGDLIPLARRRTAHGPGPSGGLPRGRQPATFAFDIASPLTYLAAERADRLFPDLVWRPVIAGSLQSPTGGAGWEDVRAAAEERAGALGLPIVWPEGFGRGGRRAMRVAALAADLGRGAPFVLAAGRLAFCGGFDLDEPETLAEAAAAAGLALGATMAAARDSGRDARMEADGRRLLALGVDRLPAVVAGEVVVCGEERLTEAALAWRRLGGGEGGPRPASPERA